MSWFGNLFGFEESSPDQVRENLVIEGSEVISLVNRARYRWGHLLIPSLGELRAICTDEAAAAEHGALRVSEWVGDVAKLHASDAGDGAHFQVASQFNLLEMVGPGASPEAGVGIYEHDLTQGPACAIACGAGTVYRNYFVPLEGQIGQSVDQQVDCAADLEKALMGTSDESLWQMRNGYLLPTSETLAKANQRIEAADEGERDRLRAALRIGWQFDTEVTLEESGNRVSQAFCSAVPIAYASLPTADWEPLARLILEASYEAALLAGLLNRHRTGNRSVYLTLLGGGAFGNPREWIFAALERALRMVETSDLEVSIVSYGASNSEVRRFVGDW